MINESILETIRSKIIESGRDTRYKIEAYVFVLNGLDYNRAKTGEKRHFTGQELAGAFAELAAKQFGPLGWDVLQSWGVSTTDDFGFIVYNMIDIRIIRKQPTDSINDFQGVLDLKEYLADQTCYQIDREHIRSLKGA
ncbi:MAG: hypothetical protein GF344_10645 [Chitinivibrionales bacterium]|nr:hypothetical protein [Chitinivibrionales bacterium]MBD3357273.1 hypothetical protein [Chitinivibrionales bacterium]